MTLETGRERGRFIAFEGGEACGKSTQASRLAQALGAVLTREPGGTELGESIRRLVLDPAAESLDHRAETLLMAAARAQHAQQVIAPALAVGNDVISDRFTGSSLAYQGYGRGVPLDDVAAISDFATRGLSPDLVILLVVDAAVAAARRPGPEDRLENEEQAFHERVMAGYRALAAADPEHWRVVDGSGTEDEVAARVLAVVEPAQAR